MDFIRTYSGVEEVNLDKIYSYIKNLKLKYNLKNISPFRISKMIITDIMTENITTNELNIQTCNLCLNMSYQSDYDYYKLAGYIYCDNMHKNMCYDIKKLYDHISESNPSLLSNDFTKFVERYAEDLHKIVCYDNDFLYDYFALTTLEKGYLISDTTGTYREVPQQMLLRVAIQIHCRDESDDLMNSIKKTYDYLSNHYYTHATPTLFNSGFRRNQLSSCFLLGNLCDSIDSIYGKALMDSALISKNSGGLGIALHSIRAKGSHIRGTNGYSNGIIPMLRVFDATAKYVDQGGGKRNGSIAFFLEPWHADVIDFLNAKRPSGDDNKKARDLFYALWIPDLFMKRLIEDEIWSLFCPNKCPGMDTVYGDEFEALYKDYEDKKMYNAQIKASELFYLICDTLIETGTPYILFKDNVNKYSNQKNLGTIRSSNLCCEIMQYSDPNETAVCNLASINLSKFCSEDSRTYDFKTLWEVAYQCTVNLNNLIDVTYYPTESCYVSNKRHRPIAVGVQGLANVFFKMKYEIDSTEARVLNDDIFETIYHGSLTASMHLAKKHGPYESFPGSPFSMGLFQFDLLGKCVGDINGFSEKKPKMSWDWESLRSDIVKYGVRNSQLTAVMPTASTSQLLGNYEGIEFPQSNIFVRSTKAGKFPVVNNFLVKDLVENNLWTDDIRKKIIFYKGSIAEIKEIPDKIKKMYPTIWTVPQKVLIDMSIDRQKYIDQSQSLNIYYNPGEANIYQRLMSVIAYSWKNKLKTAIYYLRSKPASYAANFTDEGFVPDETSDCVSCSC